MKEKLERIFGKGNVVVKHSREDITYIFFWADGRQVKGSIVTDANDGSIWHIEYRGQPHDLIRLSEIIEESWDYEE